MEERREARRRKILENGTNRIKKITGVESKSLLNEIPYPNNIQNDISIQEEVVGQVELSSSENDSPSVSTKSHRKITKSDSLPMLFSRFRLLFLVALAVLVSFESLWPFNNVIFMPILTYKLLEYFTIPSAVRNNSRSDKKILLLLFSLISVKTHSSITRNLLNLLDQIANIIQDVMIYFFVFIFVNILKNLVIH